MTSLKSPSTSRIPKPQEKGRKVEKLVDALSKASGLVEIASANTPIGIGTASSEKKNSFFHDDEDHVQIDTRNNNVVGQELKKQLINSIVFMDQAFAETFSWSQSTNFTEGKQDASLLTPNHIMKLGALTILSLHNTENWPSLDRIQQLAEMNVNWNDYVQNSKKTAETVQQEDSDEDDGFEKFYSDDDEEEKPATTTPSNNNIIIEKDMLNSTAQSSTTPMTPSFSSKTSICKRAIFFVTNLTKELESQVKTAIQRYNLMEIFYYCAFSEGYCEYYQSTAQDCGKTPNYIPVVHPFKNYLTYSDLVEQTRLLIIEWQYLTFKKEKKITPKEEELNRFVSVQIKHYPFNIAHIFPDVFYTPTCTDVFPIVTINKPPSNPTSQKSGLLSGFNLGSSPKEKSKSSHVMEFQDLPPSFQLQFRKLSATLRDMIKNLRMSVDIYSLGQSSNIIAEDIQGLIGEETFNTTDACTLILVDRTLDLVAASVHSENLFDKLLCGEETFCGLQIFPHGNSQKLKMMRALFDKSPKDSLSELQRILLEDVQKGTNVKNQSSSLDRLSSTLESLQTRDIAFNLENGELLEFVSSVLNKLKSSKSETKQAELSSVEKLILYECDSNQEELLNSIISLLKKEGEKFNVEDILRLTSIIYSVVTPECTFDGENELKDMICKKIIQEANESIGHKNGFLVRMLKPDTLKQLESEKTQNKNDPKDEDEEDWDNWNEEFSDEEDINSVQEYLREELDYHFKCLNAIKKQREQLQTLRKLAGNEHTFIFENPGVFGETETPYRSLCMQLAYVIGQSEPCNDLVHSTSLLGSISNTFGFMLQKKTKLIRDESSTIIIFVVGGITCGEIADIRNMIEGNIKEKGIQSPYHGKDVLIGSTSMITSPHFIPYQLFTK